METELKKSQSILGENVTEQPRETEDVVRPTEALDGKSPSLKPEENLTWEDISEDSDKEAGDELTHEELSLHLQELYRKYQTIYGKIQTLEDEVEENKMVIGTLQKVDDNRQCFRVVGGVLTKRNVKDVSPSLLQYCAKLEKVVIEYKKEMMKLKNEISECKIVADKLKK